MRSTSPCPTTAMSSGPRARRRPARRCCARSRWASTWPRSTGCSRRSATRCCGRRSCFPSIRRPSCCAGCAPRTGRSAGCARSARNSTSASPAARTSAGTPRVAAVRCSTWGATRSGWPGCCSVPTFAEHAAGDSGARIQWRGRRVRGGARFPGGAPVAVLGRYATVPFDLDAHHRRHRASCGCPTRSTRARRTHVELWQDGERTQVWAADPVPGFQHAARHIADVVRGNAEPRHLARTDARGNAAVLDLCRSRGRARDRDHRGDQLPGARARRAHPPGMGRSRCSSTPGLVPRPRYVADHGGTKPELDAAGEARWRGMLERAEICFDFDCVAAGAVARQLSEAALGAGDQRRYRRLRAAARACVRS